MKKENLNKHSDDNWRQKLSKAKSDLINKDKVKEEHPKAKQPLEQNIIDEPRSVVEQANEEIQLTVLKEYKAILDEAHEFREDPDLKHHKKEKGNLHKAYLFIKKQVIKLYQLLISSFLRVWKRLIAEFKRFGSFVKYKVQHPINHNEARKYKIFFVSDMEEESRFLHEMSIKGLHFKKKWGIEYIFEKGLPKNYYYHLGYYEKDKRDGERYQRNYEDAGWKIIYQEKGEFDGVWHYFRLEVESGEVEPKIFSDRLSRTALYNRLLSNWRTLLAMIVICLLFMFVFVMFLNSKAAIVNQSILLMCSVLAIIMSFVFLTYLRIYLKIKKKLTVIME